MFQSFHVDCENVSKKTLQKKITVNSSSNKNKNVEICYLLSVCLNDQNVWVGGPGSRILVRILFVVHQVHLCSLQTLTGNIDGVLLFCVYFVRIFLSRSFCPTL